MQVTVSSGRHKNLTLRRQAAQEIHREFSRGSCILACQLPRASLVIPEPGAGRPGDSVQGRWGSTVCVSGSLLWVLPGGLEMKIGGTGTSW